MFSVLTKNVQQRPNCQCGKLVDRYSATLEGMKPIALERRHSMMHKFNSPDDMAFLQIADVLEGLVDQARSVLERRRQ